jgi:hypothetical protein
MRSHGDFEDLGFLAAGEGDEGLAAAPTAPLLFRQVVGLYDCGELAVVAFGRAATTGLLAPRPARRWVVRRSRQGSHRLAGFRGPTEKLLLEQTDLGLELLNLFFQPCFPLDSPLMQGTIVLSLAVIVEIASESPADRTRPLRRWGCRLLGYCHRNSAKGIHAAM